MIPYFARRFILLTIFRHKIVLILLILCTSCTVPPPNEENPTPLYAIIPAHQSCIAPGDVQSWMLWALFGNDDDGIYGEGPKAHFCEDEPNTTDKFWRWWRRNPLHNFTFYVIGSADRFNSAFALLKVGDRGSCIFYPQYHPTEYPFDHIGLYLALHGGKPFLSLRFPWTRHRSFNFYCGWRCRGNFGMVLHPFKRTRIKCKYLDCNHLEEINLVQQKG